MGTDIHGIFQAKNGRGWKDIPHKWGQDRHYQLFAILAGVRNGAGFAGVKYAQAVKPIAEPRGLPADFEMVGDDHPVTDKAVCGDRAEWMEDNLFWMGSHDHSWISAEEILAYPLSAYWHTGVVDVKQFLEWDGVKRPESYSGDVWGKDILISSPVEVCDKTTHVRVYWMESQAEDFSDFMNEVKRLKAEHGTVRLVFGFDS